MDFGLDKAAKTAVDEAAIKLDPMVTALIDHAIAGIEKTLRDLLVGRTFTFTISIK